MLTGDRNVGMTQSSTGRVDPVLSAYLAAKLLPQCVERLVTADTVIAKPFTQRLEKSLAPIVGVRCTEARCDLRLDHKVSSGSRTEPSKDFQQFCINFHVPNSIF